MSLELEAEKRKRWRPKKIPVETWPKVKKKMGRPSKEELLRRQKEQEELQIQQEELKKKEQLEKKEKSLARNSWKYKTKEKLVRTVDDVESFDISREQEEFESIKINKHKLSSDFVSRLVAKV